MVVPGNGAPLSSLPTAQHQLLRGVNKTGRNQGGQPRGWGCGAGLGGPNGSDQIKAGGQGGVGLGKPDNPGCRDFQVNYRIVIAGEFHVNSFFAGRRVFLDIRSCVKYRRAPASGIGIGSLGRPEYSLRSQRQSDLGRTIGGGAADYRLPDDPSPILSMASAAAPLDVVFRIMRQPIQRR